MNKDIELKSRDKTFTKMGRDGAVEVNDSTGEGKRISGRLEDAGNLRASSDIAERIQFNGGRDTKCKPKRRQKYSESEAYLDSLLESVGVNAGINSNVSIVNFETAESQYKVADQETYAEEVIISSEKPIVPEAKEVQLEKRRERNKNLIEKHTRHLAKSENKSSDKSGKSRLRFDDEAVVDDVKNIVSNKRTIQKKSANKIRFDEGLSPAAKLADVAGNQIHNKVSENEDDNVGIQAAHRTEMAAEMAVNRIGDARGRKESKLRIEENGSRPSKLKVKSDSVEKYTEAKVQTKLYEKSGGASAKVSAKAKASDELGRSKAIQKNRLKHAYADAKRNPNGKSVISSITDRFNGNSAREAAKAVGDKAGAVIKKVVENHKGAIAIVVVAGIAAVFILNGAGVATTMISEVGQAVTESTYLSADNDIIAGDEAYEELEDELQEQIDRIETDYPDFDEYRYQLDELTHDPYALTSYLTAKYGNYKIADVESELLPLFREQFKLTLTQSTETRTRTVTSTNPESGETSTSTETYTVKILTVKLTNKGMDAIAQEQLTVNQLKEYKIYQASLGNRSYLFGDSITVGNPATGGLSYEIPPEALEDEQFAGMIREAEKYLGRDYVWGGSSPSTGFDCSGFVSWVINNSGNGWNVGRQTANGLLSNCTYVSASQAKPGDLIFFQGTYDVSGASHVGIYVGDGKMIHCGNPIQYTSINSNYWQKHFLSFGRITD